jgi:predicted DNA-binding transcriptional regulator YafY
VITVFLILNSVGFLYYCVNHYSIPLATNKHAQIRYNTLNKCFRNSGKRFAIEDLVEACNEAIYEFTGKEDGIKKRQLYDDVRFMESEQGWSIELKKTKDGRKVYYSYEDPNFSISNKPLNETEANQLKEALLTLSRFKGMPQYDWIDELGTRLDAEFKLNKNSEKVMSFEENEYLEGKPFISDLYNAIIYKKVVAIEYKTFKNENSITYELSPYHLKQYNKRWFLFGKSQKFDTLTNVALDRILSIKDTDKTYEEGTIDFSEYFEDIVGVTIPEAKVVPIKIRVVDTMVPYIKTKPLHASQIYKFENDEHFIILKVIPNYELESVLLSYGENLRVIQPDTFVDKMKSRIEKMNKNY